MQLQAAQSTAAGLKKTGVLHELIKNKFLYMLIFPGLLFFIVFNYLPMFGIIIAFEDYNPILGLKGFLTSPFVGLRNFNFFFINNEWIHITKNTIFLNTLFIAGDMISQIGFALMLSEIARKLFKKITQTIVLFPHFISWPIVVLFADAIISPDNGIFNQAVAALGGKPVDFLTEPSIWPAILIICRMWKGVGFGSIVFLAAITGIEQEMYESAKIDGANRLKCIWHITLPMLKGTTVILLLLAVGRIFYGDFGLIYSFVGNNSLLYPTTDIIDTYVFRALRINNDMGMAAAVGLFQSAFGFVIVSITNLIIKKVAPEYSLF